MLFTRDQERIINEGVNKHLLIDAGAGTGKTQVIAARICKVIEKRFFSPEKTWAISFTNNASKELSNRITELAGKEIGIHSTNFHKMSAYLVRNIIRLFSYHEFIPATFSILTPDQASVLMRSIRDKSMIKISKFDSSDVGEVDRASELLSKLSRLKNIGINIDDDFNFFEAGLTTSSGYVLREYDYFCRMNGMFDFDDLFFQLGKFLEIEEIAAWASNQFQCLFIDEFQDISKSQMDVIEKLAVNAHLSVVGDASQAIYEWRGATHQHFIDFGMRDSVTTLKLRYNFRSHKGILEIPNALIREKINLEHSNLMSAGSSEHARKLEHENEAAESIAIANQICALIDAGEYQAEDFAVLYRSKSFASTISNALQAKGIKSNIYGSHNFWDRAVIKTLMAYLRLSINPGDFPSFSYIAKQIKGVGEVSINKMLGEKEILKTLSAIKPEAAAELSMLIESLNASSSLSEMIGIFLMNPLVICQEDNIKESIELIESLQAFINHKNMILIDDLFEYSSLTGDKNSRAGGVNLMTMHASKGSQFKVVFVTGLNQGQFPCRVHTRDELKAETRLLYVAMTRSTEILYLSYIQERLTQMLRPYENGLEDWTNSINEGVFTSYFQKRNISSKIVLSNLHLERKNAVKASNRIVMANTRRSTYKRGAKPICI